MKWRKQMATVVEGEFPVEQLRARKRSFSPFFLCLSQRSQARVEQTRESLKRAINEQAWVVNECSKVCKTDPWIRSGSNLKTILSINPLHFLLAPRGCYHGRWSHGMILPHLFQDVRALVRAVAESEAVGLEPEALQSAMWPADVKA